MIPYTTKNHLLMPKQGLRDEQLVKETGDIRSLSTLADRTNKQTIETNTYTYIHIYISLKWLIMSKIMHIHMHIHIE